MCVRVFVCLCMCVLQRSRTPEVCSVLLSSRRSQILSLEQSVGLMFRIGINQLMDSLSDNHLYIIATSVSRVKVEHERPCVWLPGSLISNYF